MSTHLDTIFLLGDSLTQGGWEPGGFAQRLAYVYARKFDVINRGLSGYNSEWAIPVFERCLIPVDERDAYPRIKMLLVWFGANDACIPPSPQHLPLDKYKANHHKIIDLVKSPSSQFYDPNTKIILLTPPPINTYQRGAELGSRNPPVALDRKFEVTKQYAQVVKEVAKEKGTFLVDIWQAIWDRSGREEKAMSKYLSDGVHFTPEGYEVVYDEIIKVIQEQIPELHYERLKSVFPAWDQIDWNDPIPSIVPSSVFLK